MKTKALSIFISFFFLFSCLASQAQGKRDTMGLEATAVSPGFTGATIQAIVTPYGNAGKTYFRHEKDTTKYGIQLFKGTEDVTIYSFWLPGLFAGSSYRMRFIAVDLEGRVLNNQLFEVRTAGTQTRTETSEDKKKKSWLARLLFGT